MVKRGFPLSDDLATSNGEVDEGMRKPRGIQSVVIEFRALECLGEAPTPLGLKALSEVTNMLSSKLRFYLVSLGWQEPADGADATEG